MTDHMASIQTLISAINDILSAAAEEIFVVVESTLTEYEDRDVCFRQQIEQQRRILDGLLKPHVKLHRAVISKATASDYWNSVRRTQQLSSALSVLGKDCNAEPGSSKDSHSPSSSAQGELYSEGLTSAEQQLPAKPEKASSGTDTAAAPAVQTNERVRDYTALHSSCLSPCHVPMKDFMERTPVVAMDRGEAGQMMKKKKLFDRLRPILTKTNAKRHAGDSQERQTRCDTDKQTSDRSSRDNQPSSSSSILGKDSNAESGGSKAAQSSSSTRGQFHSERRRHKERQLPAGASADNIPSENAESPSATASNPFAVNGSNTVARPATLAALAARGWRGMKVVPVRRRVRVRDHTVLHPSLLSLCHVTIQDIMERSMALAREAGWKRKKLYSPPFKHSRFRPTQAKTNLDTSDSQDSQTSSDTATDRELHQHLLQMFEEDGNEEDFLGFPASDEQTSVQKDVEDSQPSDRGTPDSNLKPTTMVSDIPETTASHGRNSMRTSQLSSALSIDSSIMTKYSNAEPGGSKDSQFTSSSTKGELYAGLTSAKKQLLVESPAELMTPQLSSALSMDSSILAKDSNAEPGGTKDSQSPSTQGEQYSEGLTRTKQQLPEESPAEVMTPHPPPALIIDFSILEKYSNDEAGGSKNTQPSSMHGELTSLEQKLPAESPAEPPVDIPSAPFTRRASNCKEYHRPGQPEVRNQQPSSVLSIDSGILGKDSIADPGGSKDSQSSSPSTHGEFYSERLRSSEQQLPAESLTKPPVDIPFAELTRRASNCKEYCRPFPPIKASSSDTAGSSSLPGGPVTKRARGRPRKTPAAAAPVVETRESLQDCTLLKPSLLSIPTVTIPDFMQRSMEDLAREAVEKKKLDDLARQASEKKLYAPPVKRTRLAIEDKEGLEGGVAFDGSSSKMEYFGFDDLGKSDSDEERTQAKVTMEAAAVLASLSTSMDDYQGNQTSSSNTDFLHLPVFKEVVSTERQERSPIRVQEAPEPLPQSKEQQEELAKRPEEALPTLPASKSEDYNENSWTEPLSSTSSEHMETRDGGALQPAREGQSLRLHCSESDSDNSEEWEETRGRTSTGRVKTQAEVEDCGETSHTSESDTEDSGSEWDETMEAQPASKSLRSRRSNNGSQDRKASKRRIRADTSCTVCGKQFRYNINLLRHKRIHTGEKPFTCTICSTSFNQQEHLLKHMISIHSGNKPLMCTVCGESFTVDAHLEKHMLSHTAFGCTVCDKVFGQKNALNTHMRRTHTATAKKPFSCTVCNKSFGRNFALAGHMTSHTKGKNRKK